MMSVWKKIAAAGLAAAMGVSLLAGCGSKAAKIDGTKTAVTVNDEAVSLGAVSFQARYQQAYMHQIYSMYFGQSEIFDNVVDESTEKTYGDQIKENVLEDIEEMVLLKQHAADYDVKISDEKKKEFETIAQAYMDENDEDVRSQIGASREDVIYLLELQTIRDMMREPMVKDVDTEVSDDEAQQTTVTYVSIAKKTEADVEADESAADTSVTDTSAADESVADTSAADESVADTSVADTSVADTSVADTTVAEESKASAALIEANAKLKENAQKIIADIKAAGNTADADMDAIAKAVDESLTASTGQFTTNDKTDTSLDSSIVEAVSGLKDGELCSDVVETESNYYVVRVDKVFDESATETKKEDIVRSRKQDAYKKLVEEWKKDAKITVDEKAMATLLITDSVPYTLKQDESVADESVADESAADSSLSDVTTADAAAAELADESVN